MIWYAAPIKQTLDDVRADETRTQKNRPLVRAYIITFSFLLWFEIFIYDLTNLTAKEIVYENESANSCD